MTQDTSAVEARMAEIRAGLVGVTPGPYRPCVHLRSKEGDDGCSCGYRGGVWSEGTDEILFEMGGTPESDGCKMVPEPDRDTRRLNAQHLARLDPATVLSILDAYAALQAERDRMRGALKECRSALAMMVRPGDIEQTTVVNAFAAATAAEAKARQALNPGGGHGA